MVLSAVELNIEAPLKSTPPTCAPQTLVAAVEVMLPFTVYEAALMPEPLLNCTPLCAAALLVPVKVTTPPFASITLLSKMPLLAVPAAPPLAVISTSNLPVPDALISLLSVIPLCAISVNLASTSDVLMMSALTVISPDWLPPRAVAIMTLVPRFRL